MKRFVPATLHKFNKIRRSLLYRTIAPLYIEFLFLLWCLLLMRRRRFSTSISYFLMYAKSFNRKQLFAVWTRMSFIMHMHLVSFQTLLCKLKRYVTHIARNSHAHFSFIQKQQFQLKSIRMLLELGLLKRYFVLWIFKILFSTFLSLHLWLENYLVLNVFWHRGSKKWARTCGA